MATGPVNINGVFYMPRTREDGSTYTERVNEDGTPWVDPNPGPTAAELATGIGIGGASQGKSPYYDQLQARKAAEAPHPYVPVSQRSPETQAAWRKANFGGAQARRAKTGIAAGPGVQQSPKPSGVASQTLQPTTVGPEVLPEVNLATNTVTNTNLTGASGSTNTTGGVASNQVASVSNLPADQLKSVDDQAYFARYPDVAAAYRNDPKGMSADEFARWHWETYGKAEGRDMPYSTDMPTNQTVGPGTWFQNGPEGDQFEVVNVNPDGTITWKRREDGFVFQNIDAATFESFFPGWSGRYYTSMRTVDPAKETVAGQLQALLGADSTYLQRSRARVSDRMNARGLMNSTIAGQAGEAAAIDAALPIAQADAGIYGGASQYNTELKNKMTVDAMNQTRTQNNMKLTASIAKDTRHDAAAIAENFEKLKSQLNYESSASLKAIDHNYKQLSQYSTGATQVMQTFNTQVATILASPDIAQENKQGLIDQLTTVTNNSLIAMKAMYGLE